MEYILQVYDQFVGTGVIMGLYFISLCYLFVKEENKNNRIFFIYMPCLVMLIFFNPLWCYFVDMVVGNDIYFRFLWLLPIAITIAYTAIMLIKEQKGKRKVIVTTSIAMMIILSGNFVYENSYFSFIENEYHMPQSVVDICDYIQVEGREVKGLFPTEMISYVRQYDATIFLAYGREVLMEGWGAGVPKMELKQLMEEESYDIDTIAPYAKEMNCHYIIFKEEKEIQGSMSDYDYELVTTIQGYDIYLDTSLYLGI